jgi:hypothetical protein
MTFASSQGDWRRAILHDLWASHKYPGEKAVFDKAETFS